MYIANALKAIVKSQKTTLRAVESKCGEYQGTMSHRLRNGNMTLRTLIDYAEALDYEVLLSPRDEKTEKQIPIETEKSGAY